MMSQKLDLYLAKAIKENLVEIDGKYLVITEAGQKVFDDICEACIKIIDNSNEYKDFLTGAAKVIREATGQEITPLDLFKQMMMSTIQGGEPQLLAFLMHEKDSDYAYLKESLKQPLPDFGGTPKKSHLSSVKKTGQKYDA